MGTAFLFPGQGSQYVEMGVAWYRASAEARMLCDQADAQLGYALTQLCFEGPEADLNLTEFTQPAIFVVSVAMWQAVKPNLPEPDFISGHSLGEFVALVVSGALDFEEGLYLVRERGRLMARAGEHSPGGMAVLLGVSLQDAEVLCKVATEVAGEPLVVANDNCPGQVVISGARAALDVAVDLAASYGVRRIRRLPVSVAPHSPLMADVQAAFAQLLDTVPLREPQIPVVLNATATPVTDPERIRQALSHQLTSPVRWRESLLWMAAQGVDHFVEIGPKNVLAGLVRRTLSDVCIETAEEMAFSLEGWSV